MAQDDAETEEIRYVMARWAKPQLAEPAEFTIVYLLFCCITQSPPSGQFSLINTRCFILYLMRLNSKFTVVIIGILFLFVP